MRKSTFLLSAAAAVVVALASERAVTRTLDGPPAAARQHALWAYHPQDPAQMARDVDAVVVATLAGVRPGRTASASSGAGSLSFELDEFMVEESIKGSAGGETLFLERVAALPGELFPEHDGGAYDKGRRYLLFLRKQSTTTLFYLVHPEGRYTVGDDGLVTPAAEGAVAQRLSGQPLKDVVALLQAAVAKP